MERLRGERDKAKSDWEKKYKEREEIESELTSLNDRLYNIDERYRQQAVEMLKTDNPPVPDKIWIDENLSHAQTTKEAIMETFSFMDKSILADPVNLPPDGIIITQPKPKGFIGVDVGVNTNAKTRSHFRPSTHQIRLDAGDFAQKWVTVHEMGHWLETKNPEIGRKGVAFRNKRAGSEQPTHLGGSYGPNEVAVRDQFMDHYMGKIYDDKSSEIISMGLQYFFEKPIEFAKTDPEYFDFMFGLLRGG